MTMKQRQNGFSLISAIFLVTVLAALGLYLLVMSGVAQQTPVMAMTGAQTYHAARSGLEWGIAGAINNDSTVNCNGSFSVGQYDIAVSCTVSTHGGGNTYAIESSATTGIPGSLNFATRTLRATVSPAAP